MHVKARDISLIGVVDTQALYYSLLCKGHKRMKVDLAVLIVRHVH